MTVPLQARPARPWRRLPLFAVLLSSLSLPPLHAGPPVPALHSLQSLPSPSPPAATPITVEVDARRAAQGVFHSHLVLPATPGPLVVTYPKWIPGEHSPTGPIQQLVGLRFTAGGSELAWKRDPVDMFAFHLEVPAGAKAIENLLGHSWVE